MMVGFPPSFVTTRQSSNKLDSTLTSPSHEQYIFAGMRAITKQTMELTQNSINNLINYIKANEVVYQRFGELVEVANNDNKQNTEALLEDIDKASGIEIYKKGASFIHDDFVDLDEWAKDNDTMFLLEVIGTLICIPTKCAIENDIIAA